MADYCHVFWRSHGCDLPRFHDGDSLSHVCDPCPPDCTPTGEDYDSMWASGDLADQCGFCERHCNDRPGHADVLYGEDVEHFPAHPRMPS